MSGGRTRPHAAPLVLGWRECVALPAFGVDALLVKVDTGARTSALHVLSEEIFLRDGAGWVRFLLDDAVPGVAGRWLEAPVADRRVVTDSGGRGRPRVFIRTRLALPDGRAWEIEVNLTERGDMQFPMLLGRSALPRGSLVAPGRSFLLGRPAAVGAVASAPPELTPPGLALSDGARRA
jgi:hypothetical protein